jgi:AcrR family transcriptional regulator
MVETTPKPSRTQEERNAKSGRAIIRAAIELFARQGYMRTTISQVGKTAGYTGGLVSHRFGTKEALLKAVVHHMSSRYLHDQLPSLREQESPEQALEKHIETYFKELATREKSMRALYVIMGEALGAVPEIQKDIAKLNEGVRFVIAEMVERGVKSGAFRPDVDPGTAAVIILGLLRGVAMQVITARSSLDLKTLLPVVQKQVILGLK